MKKEKIEEFIIKTIKGIIVGIGVLTAGAGTFAIVLGIYDRCMEIIAKPFKNFKENYFYTKYKNVHSMHDVYRKETTILKLHNTYLSLKSNAIQPCFLKFLKK